MQLSNFLLSIASLSFASNVLAAPADAMARNQVRDDDDGPVVVKLKTTVHNIVTNTHYVEGSVVTLTNTNLHTDVSTTTRYTATVTSTVFGTPITFTTVAPTPIDTSNIKIPTETAAAETTTATTSSSKATTTTKASTKQSKTTQAKAKTTSKAASKTTEIVTDDATTGGPSITDVANIPTSTDSYIIENITTSKSAGVCYVDYDYYVSGEDDETVTSTKTITQTVTRS